METTTRRPLTAEDLWALPRVGAPVPSPDAALLAVPVTTYDMEKNEGRTRIWLVPTKGGDPRPATSGDLSSDQPAWSPDGKRLALVRRREREKPQLHILPVDGGEAEKITDMPLGVADPKWFPDGKRIAFLSPVLIEAPTLEATRTRIPEKEKDLVRARVTEDRVYRFWDRWLAGGEVPHLFVIDLATRAVTDLTPGSLRWFDFMEPAGQYDISPDGAEIAFSANASEPPHNKLNWDVFTVPTAGGEVKNLTAGNPADDVRPRYSPDGRFLLYGMQKEWDFYADRVRIVRYERRTGDHRNLTEDWDRSADAWKFAKDGSFFVQAEDRGRVSVFHGTLEGGAPREVRRGGTITGITPGADGRVYFQVQDLSRPPEIASCLPDGSDYREHTRFTQELLSRVSMGETREMTYEGTGGAKIQMYIVTPPGFDPKKKWPLVHVLHGGPHAISGDAFHFRWNAQLFAAPGYVVALPNFHGSTSFGQEFAASILGDHASKPFEDVMRATDAMIAAGYVDASRMAVTGGSYGGYLVSWIGGHTDRFRAIVCHAGVTDLLSQYASDVTQGRSRAYGGEPWDGLERIDRASPTRSAKGFVTPMLVIHGENDYRVPLTQGFELYGILKAKGVPARLVYFPDENHWVLKPQNSRLWYREVHAWLARHLG